MKGSFGMKIILVRSPAFINSIVKKVAELVKK